MPLTKHAVPKDAPPATRPVPVTEQLLDALAANPDGLSLDQLAERFPGRLRETLRSTACRLTSKGLATRIGTTTWRLTEKGQAVIAGALKLNNFRAPTEEERETWEAPKWVHPIRARILPKAVP